MVAAVGIGSRLGGYRIESLVTGSPSGTVYRARRKRSDAPVALEVVAPELASVEGLRERLERAGRHARSLAHPGIAPVHEVGEADGTIYVVSEWVDGVDLATLIERMGSLSFLRAAGVVHQAAAALDLAHANQLVHGALEPRRLIVADEEGADRIVLTGFASVPKPRSNGRGPALRSWVGPPPAAYAAPEQIRGAEVGPHADVYALGCILYEAVVGQPPFVRDTADETLAAHLVKEPPAVSERALELPAAFDARREASTCEGARRALRSRRASCPGQRSRLEASCPRPTWAPRWARRGSSTHGSAASPRARAPGRRRPPRAVRSLVPGSRRSAKRRMEAEAAPAATEQAPPERPAPRAGARSRLRRSSPRAPPARPCASWRRRSPSPLPCSPRCSWALPATTRTSRGGRLRPPRRSVRAARRSSGRRATHTPSWWPSRKASEGAALASARRARRLGLDAGVLNSSDYTVSGAGEDRGLRRDLREPQRGRREAARVRRRGLTRGALRAARQRRRLAPASGRGARAA